MQAEVIPLGNLDLFVGANVKLMCWKKTSKNKTVISPVEILNEYEQLMAI